MARVRRWAARFGFGAMLSAEPWTVSDCGFLNLLATGEICEGDTIHDRQHPHDLFMELAIDFDRPLAAHCDGRSTPVLRVSRHWARGFPHRFSAISNPIAPISHHWLDSSHITFGLVTGSHL